MPSSIGTPRGAITSASQINVKVVCSGCHHTFLTPGAAYLHVDHYKHREGFAYKCRACPQLFITRSACNEHMNTERHWNLICKACWYLINDPEGLSNKTGILSCPDCDAPFVDLPAFAQHASPIKAPDKKNPTEILTPVVAQSDIMQTARKSDRGGNAAMPAVIAHIKRAIASTKAAATAHTNGSNKEQLATDLKCLSCDKKFNDAIILVFHLIAGPHDEKKYTCPHVNCRRGELIGLLPFLAHMVDCSASKSQEEMEAFLQIQLDAEKQKLNEQKRLAAKNPDLDEGGVAQRSLFYSDSPEPNMEVVTVNIAGVRIRMEPEAQAQQKKPEDGLTEQKLAQEKLAQEKLAQEKLAQDKQAADKKDSEEAELARLKAQFEEVRKQQEADRAAEDERRAAERKAFDAKLAAQRKQLEDDRKAKLKIMDEEIVAKQNMIAESEAKKAADEDDRKAKLKIMDEEIVARQKMIAESEAKEAAAEERELAKQKLATTLEGIKTDNASTRLATDAKKTYFNAAMAKKAAESQKAESSAHRRAIEKWAKKQAEESKALIDDARKQWAPAFQKTASRTVAPQAGPKVIPDQGKNDAESAKPVSDEAKDKTHVENLKPELPSKLTNLPADGFKLPIIPMAASDQAQLLRKIEALAADRKKRKEEAEAAAAALAGPSEAAKNNADIGDNRSDTSDLIEF